MFMLPIPCLIITTSCPYVSTLADCSIRLRTTSPTRGGYTPLQPEGLGVTVQGIRETCSNEQVELECSSSNRGQPNSAFCEVVGQCESIRHLIPRIEVEILVILLIGNRIATHSVNIYYLLYIVTSM